MAEDGKVIFKYVGDTDGIDQANAEAKGKIGKLGAVAGKAAAAIGAAAVAAGTAVVKIGADFESAFAGVIKTVDATDAQLAALRDGILDMSKELPATAAEIAGVAESAGQLGIETDNILGFTRAMIDLGEATNLTADEAATQLARFANIMQMPQTEFDKLGSTIVALGNNFATTEAEIVAMGMRLAGAGKQANMSESDIMGIAAALSSVGIEAEAGGSAFSKVITDINIAVQTGNEDLEKFADVAGMSAQQFAQAFQTDAAGAVASFVAGLGRMEEQGSSAILTLEDLGIREIRMRDALLRASGAGDLLTESLGMANQAWAENTALATEAEQRYATLESRWAMLKNQVSAIAISLYDQMRPALSGVLDGVSGMFKAMEESGALEAFGESLGKLATVLGDAIIDALPVIVQLITDLLPPILQLAEMALPAIVQLAEALLPVITEVVSTLLPPLVEIFNALLPPLMELVEALLPPFLEIFNALAGPLGELTEALLPVLVELLQLLTPLVQALTPIISAFADVLSGTLSDSLENVMTLVDAVMGVFRGLIDFIVGVFTGDWERAWSGIVSLLKGILNLIPAAIESVINGAIALINGLIRGVNKISEAIGLGSIGLIGNVSLGRFRVGLDYVPEDDFPALLHKGEMVLTAGEAREYRRLDAMGALAAAGFSGYNSSAATNVYFGEGAIAITTSDKLSTRYGAQQAGANLMDEMARQMRNRGM